MSIIEVKNDEYFEQILENKKDKLLLIDFFADWCAPCKEFAKVLLELENNKEISNNILSVKCDIANCAQTATKYNVQSIPTIILIKNKVVMSRRVGSLNTQAAHSWITEHMEQR